jgi:hypothetical protein
MDDQSTGVLCSGRATLPVPYWLWVPAAVLTAFAGGLVLGSVLPAALVAAAVGLAVALRLFARASWSWRMTASQLEVGRLSWPVLRGGRVMHLSRIGKVEVTTGGREQVWDAVAFGRHDGRVFPWMHGAVIAEQGLGMGVSGPDVMSPTLAAGQRVVIGTATAAEAERTAAMLREAVAAIRTSYPLPREHHVKVLPAAPPRARTGGRATTSG